MSLAFYLPFNFQKDLNPMKCTLNNRDNTLPPLILTTSLMIQGYAVEAGV